MLLVLAVVVIVLPHCDNSTLSLFFVVDRHNQPMCPQMDVPRLLQQIPGAHEEGGHDQFRQEACVSEPAGDPDQGAVLHSGTTEY